MCSPAARHSTARGNAPGRTPHGPRIEGARRRRTPSASPPQRSGGKPAGREGAGRRGEVGRSWASPRRSSQSTTRPRRGPQGEKRALQPSTRPGRDRSCPTRRCPGPQPEVWQAADLTRRQSTCTYSRMNQGRQYRGTDHPRLALDLLRTRVKNPSPMGVIDMARRSTELGLNLQDDLGRGVSETLFAAINLAAQFAQRYASETGRSLVEVVDELSVEFEVSTPRELQVGSIEDSLRAQDPADGPGKDQGL